MKGKGNQRPRARSKPNDSENLLDRKKRLEQRHASDGVAHGVVEIPGPIPPAVETEIRNLAHSIEEREKGRDEFARILRISEFSGGLAIETESEKLAQHIADAIARSRKAKLTRTFDDEGKRRILTCRLRETGEG